MHRQRGQQRLHCNELRFSSRSRSRSRRKSPSSTRPMSFSPFGTCDAQLPPRRGVHWGCDAAGTEVQLLRTVAISTRARPLQEISLSSFSRSASAARHRCRRTVSRMPATALLAFPSVTQNDRRANWARPCHRWRRRSEVSSESLPLALVQQVSSFQRSYFPTEVSHFSQISVRFSSLHRFGLEFFVCDDWNPSTCHLSPTFCTVVDSCADRNVLGLFIGQGHACEVPFGCKCSKRFQSCRHDRCPRQT